MYDRNSRQQLLELAQHSIQHGLQTGRPLPVEPADFSSELQQQRASFVTLNKNGQLRGCIGTLEARQALVKDVADNAFSAAFRDPRFPPVEADEMSALSIHISVLSEPALMTVQSEQDLLQQLVPGKDGLILESGHHRGTFLPSVWAQLPEPEAFLRQLKIKAGLNPAGWPDDIRVSRYYTEEFGFEDV